MLLQTPLSTLYTHDWLPAASVAQRALNTKHLQREWPTWIQVLTVIPPQQGAYYTIISSNSKSTHLKTSDFFLSQPSAMAMLLMPMFPSTDTGSLPEPFKGLLSNAADGRWVKCPLSKASHGENDWTFLVVPGSLGQVTPQLWNSSFSAAVPLSSFPACMVPFESASSPLEPISLGQLEATPETASFFQACVQGIDLVLGAMAGPRSQSRSRRRRLTELRKDFTSMLARCNPGAMVWEAVGLSVQDFLQTQAQPGAPEELQWERAQQYFTAPRQTWPKGLEPGFQNPNISTAASLDILRSMLRHRMAEMVSVGEVAAVHSGFLTKHKTHLKLFVPLRQIESKGYDVQTWSQRLAWVALRDRWEEALERGAPLWGIGEVFLVDSTNLDLTRLSLLPKHTAMPFETEDASLRVVVAISSSVHEFVFAYGCLHNALRNLQEQRAADVQALAAASSAAPHGRPQTNAGPLRCWLGLSVANIFSCPPGAELKIGLTWEQQAAATFVLRHQLSLVDCLAGAGKTTVLAEVARQLTTTRSPAEYIAVVAPNKSMVQRLVKILQAAMPGTVVAPMGVVWTPENEPQDLLLEYIEERAQAACQTVLGAVDTAKRRITSANAAVAAPSSWSAWHEPWARLYLFLQVYEAEAAARNHVLASIDVLVSTTSFMRKMLGNLSPWVKSNKERTLKSLLVDEAHQDSFLQLSALIAGSQHAALFGDGLQEHMPSSQKEFADSIQQDSAFTWAQRASIPKISLPVTFRYGSMITGALRATGDCKEASSHKDAPNTFLFPLLFEHCSNVASVSGEIFFHRAIYSHFAHALCVEALVAGQRGNQISIIVIAFYVLQRTFLEQHLVQSALACISSVAQTLGLAVTEAAMNSIQAVQFFLPSQAGGSESHVAFLYLPRRSETDVTYAGTHLLSSAWRYIALTRASQRSYVLLECLESEVQNLHDSQLQKIHKWQEFIRYCQATWDQLQVEHRYKISEVYQWPSNIYTSAAWKATQLDRDWQLWAASLDVVLQYMATFAPATPSKGEVPLKFGSLFERPQTFKESVRTSEDVEHKTTKLPDLQWRYPVRYTDHGEIQTDLVRQARATLWRARDFVLDALCINIKFTEITVSLPLLMCSSWTSPVEASAVAHSLFLLFVQEELQPPSTCLMPMVVRHKKEEVELQNELFVEAQCRSDRPGFALVDPDDRQVFKLYNAMGLQHQHEDLRILLARVRSAELVVLWCRFLSRESPATFRASQVKGDEDALNHWGWHEEVRKHELVSNAPLQSLPDWLLQNQ